MSSTTKNANPRVRNYATVVYPESAPSNWLEILGEQAIPCFVSPLHNRDKNPTGEDKKEHYHVMVMFEGVKTIAQVNEIFFKIGGVGCEVVQSVRGYARYLCHLDNPEKTQYEPSEVKAFGGADYVNVIGLATDKYKAVGEMIDFCETHNLFSFRDIFLYARKHRQDWYHCLCDSCAFVIKEYLKSRKWSCDEATLDDFLSRVDDFGNVIYSDSDQIDYANVNKDTGEII